MKPSPLRRLGAVAGVIAMLAWAPCATAEPASGGALIDSPTLSLADLGSSDTITFPVHRYSTSSTTVSFPVPQGLAPVALNATLEIPVDLRFGKMTVTQEDRTISRIDLPATDQIRIVVPLAGTDIYANYASVTLTATTIPIEDHCWDPLAPMRLVNSSVTFSGTEVAPTTVATFLPPALRKLTIALPAKPSLVESNAAVQLAAGLAAHYGFWQNPEVAIVPLAEGAAALADPSAPLERQITIKEGPDAGLSLQGGEGVPALLIAGTGDQLADQTRLLTAASLPFALSPNSAAGTLSADPKPVSDTATVEQLNQTNLSSESLRPEVQINLDQSRFGHPLNRIRIHVKGSHTPLPDNFSGELVAAVGEQTIDRWPANAEGTIDHWVDLPDTLEQRSTALRIRLQTAGDRGNCNDFLGMQLRIDPSTVIQASPANTPVPPGFRSLPQSLMPRIKIGIGADAFGDTVRATQIAVGLQRISAVPLTTTVTTLQQAIDSTDPAVLVSADGWTNDKIALPFSADQGRVTINGLDTTDKPVTMTLDPAIRYGSLQTVFDGHRSMLIATSNGAPAQLDELLRWLSGVRERWSSLKGRAIISVPGSEPITVPDRPTDLPMTPDAASTGQDNGWVWWAAGGIAAVAFAGALLILLRTHKAKDPREAKQSDSIDTAG